MDNETCNYSYTCTCNGCTNATYGSMSAEEWRAYHGEPMGAKQPAELDNDY